MCINCINEAKKMLLEEQENRKWTHYEEWAYYDGKITIIEQLIERCEKLPQEPSLEELLEEMECSINKYCNTWYATKVIDLWWEIECEWNTPRKALLALKEKLTSNK